LNPGEAYKAFLSGNQPLDLCYPAAGTLARSAADPVWEAYKLASQPEVYHPVPTGISHPIILTELAGSVQAGDELLAYSPGELVGAVRITDLNVPVVLPAWAGSDEYGLELPGYRNGELIELRLFSRSENRELRVITQLDGNYYGVTPLSSGTAIVEDVAAIPTEFTLNQNYPNPFNPVTTIEFSVPETTPVTIAIYDLNGRLVRTLLDSEVMTAGYHHIDWQGVDNQGQDVAAGVYIYTLRSENTMMTRKMVLMK